jgi:DEAD/DEAH box helicase domain-containing protein
LGTPTVVPRFGYLCAAWDPPSWSGDPASIGETDIVADVDFVQDLRRQSFPNFAGHPRLEGTFCEGGRLFGANSGALGYGFAICTRCGFSAHERHQDKGRARLPHGFEVHAPLWSGRISDRCWSKEDPPVLRNHSLGADTYTDVLQLSVNTMLTTFNPEVIARTLGHAYRLAGAGLLEVDPREMQSRSTRMETGQSIHVFDSASGGSGHVRSLLEDPVRWHEAAVKLLRGDADHGVRCKQACLLCTLDAQSQGDFEAGLLDRHQALDFLER